MFKIKPTSPDYPTFAEALKAKEEANIVMKQPCRIFSSKPIMHVLFELECRLRDSDARSTHFMLVSTAFDYGYILGKRAERARRRGTVQNNTNQRRCSK